MVVVMDVDVELPHQIIPFLQAWLLVEGRALAEATRRLLEAHHMLLVGMVEGGALAEATHRLLVEVVAVAVVLLPLFLPQAPYFLNPWQG